MGKKERPPVISETAFDCPHCGAYTTQYWYGTYAKGLEKKNQTPFIPKESDKKQWIENKEVSQNHKEPIIEFLDRLILGFPFLEKLKSSRYVYYSVNNLNISECYNCQKIAIWVHDYLVFPSYSTVVTANPDMPDGIKRDFEEARLILDNSPRGAAALLRLCIQKLCINLGEKGKNIDEDIASLVSKGLDPLVQQSLDIVRVIGNESVHPGVIDLSDNKEDTIQLFGLLNAICDQMISHPKNVKSLYKKLPESKRKAIDSRNAKAKNNRTKQSP